MSIVQSDNEEFKKRVDFNCESNKELPCKEKSSDPPQKPHDRECTMEDTYENILPGVSS